jgi:hypothetical protein
MSGHTDLTAVENNQSTTTGLSVSDARILLRHYVKWLPFGGATDEEIFVLFGVKPSRYRQLVSDAADLIGHRLTPERLAQVRSSLAMRRSRVA